MSYNLRPEQLIECPYDKNHKVSAARLANHIVKCKRSHPELDAQLETCPFNALHRLLPQAMALHVLECPDNNRIFHLQPVQVPKRLDIPIPSYKRTVATAQEDDWDDTDPELLNRDLNDQSSSSGESRPIATIATTSYKNETSKNLATSNERSRPITNTGRDFSSPERDVKSPKPLSSREARDNDKGEDRPSEKNKQPVTRGMMASDDEAYRECRKMMAGRGAALRSLANKKRRTFPDDE